MNSRLNRPAYVNAKKAIVSEPLAEAAVAGLALAFSRVRKLSSYDRAAILDHVAQGLAAEVETIAQDLAAETGYLTTNDMRLEVRRAVEVFTLAAAQTRNGFTEMMTLDAVDRGRNTHGFIRREPIGPVLGICAFNGPLLIAAHKVAPAIMVGAPILLKPAPTAPQGTIGLAERVVLAGWPADAIAVLDTPDEMTRSLITDPRLPVISFTGGAFGWTIKEMAPRKHVLLELGGIGATLIARDANLDKAATECAAGGYVRSGQSCISVQRIYVDQAVAAAFTEKFLQAVKKLESDNPDDLFCRMVSEAAAARVDGFIADAQAKGAVIATGGTRVGAKFRPTVLVDANGEMAVMRSEIFGPVVAIQTFSSIDEAIDMINAVPGAIHHGAYTNDLTLANRFIDEIRAAGVIINGPCTWRVDSMPYGGTGSSGFGREGLLHAALEFTEPKAIVIRPAD